MSPTIRVNGEQRTVDEDLDLKVVVKREVGDDVDHVAVAVNGDIIPRGEWSEVSIYAGDEIEIVQPIQGGTG